MPDRRAQGFRSPWGRASQRLPRPHGAAPPCDAAPACCDGQPPLRIAAPPLQHPRRGGERARASSGASSRRGRDRRSRARHGRSDDARRGRLLGQLAAGAPSWRTRRSWRATARPTNQVKAMATIQMPTATRRGPGAGPPAQAKYAAHDQAESDAATPTDGDQRAAARDSRQALNMTGSRSPDCCCPDWSATIAGATAASSTARTPTERRQRSARLRGGRSPADDGCVIAATRRKARRTTGRRGEGRQLRTNLDRSLQPRSDCTPRLPMGPPPPGGVAPPTGNESWEGARRVLWVSAA